MKVRNLLLGALLTSSSVGLFAQQPFAGCWHPDFIHDWTPAKDPDAKFNKAAIPLKSRFVDKSVMATPNAHYEGQVAACLTMHPMCSQVPSQGANAFTGYNPTYWQYMDLLIWWGGSAGEGIILPPSAPVIDAAHQSGVKVLGQVFFPPGAFGGQVAWVTQMLTVENGDYIYAKKLYEIAKYYGFDGWFLNEETGGGSTAQWEGFIDTYNKYAALDGNTHHEIQWYDCGTSIGSKMNMIKKPGASYFLNYGSPSTSNISTQMTALQNEGFTKEEAMKKAYFGIEVAQGGYGSNNGNYFKNLYPKAGHNGSIDLFNPEEKTWKDHVKDIWNNDKNNGAQAYTAMKTSFEHEARFWVNTKNDPSNAAEYDNYQFPGMATGIAARSTVQEKPFVTAFSAGLGKYRFANGEKKGTQDWYHRGMQDILPTWRWWIETASGEKGLKVDLNWDDAYNMGTSLKISGKLNANEGNLMRMYKTNLSIASGDKFELVFKGDASKLTVKLGVKENNNEFTSFPVTISKTVGGWSVAEIDLSSLNGKTVSVIALSMLSSAQVDNYELSLGQLAIYPNNYNPTTSAVPNLTVQNQLGEDGGDIRLVWDPVEAERANIHHYNVYLERNGVKSLVGQTKGEGFYISKFKRSSPAETKVAAYLAPVTNRMVEGTHQKVEISYPQIAAPQVQLKAMKTLLKANEEVVFVARATNFPQTYTWNVQGGTLVRQNADTAVYKFANPGIYSVGVTVANAVTQTQEVVENMIEVSDIKELSTVSVGKTIHSRSGELPPETAEKLIDGKQVPDNIRDKWCIGGSKEHWAVIDLGSAHKIYRFRTFDCGHKESAADNMKFYKIFVSDNATDWTLVVDEKNRPENTKDDYIKPTVGRYVKFMPYDPEVAITIRIWEFEIFGTEGNITLPNLEAKQIPMNSTQSFEVPFDLGGDAVAENFAATVTSSNTSAVEVANVAVNHEAKKISYDLNTKAPGIADVTVSLKNGEWSISKSHQIKSVDPDMMNVALNKTITEATMGTKWDETGEVRTAVQRMIDGNESSYWLSAWDTKTYNVVVDLGENHIVSSAKLKFITDSNSRLPSNLVLSCSVDGQEYKEIKNFGNNATTNTELDFTSPEVARYFKLSYSPRNSYGAKIAEIELYGKLHSTGIESMDEANVLIYPNPVANGQQLNVKADESAKSVTIYTMAGVAVKHVAINSELTTISINDLTKGIYVVKVDGAKPYVTKLVVK